MPPEHRGAELTTGRTAAEQNYCTGSERSHGQSASVLNCLPVLYSGMVGTYSVAPQGRYGSSAAAAAARSDVQ